MTGSIVARWLAFTFSLLILAVSPVIAQTHANTAATYTITDLGTLKGDDESSGFWINSSGEVVGCSDTETDLGYPCTGLVLGQHAFSWTKSGGMKDLGTLSNGTVSGALGINDSGVVVGYSNVEGDLATNFVAVQWSSTGAITDLGTLWEGSGSGAYAINSSGEVAGDSFNHSGTVDATSWTGGDIKTITGLAGSIFNAGQGINDSGEVAGESVFSYGPPISSHGFRWTGTKTVDLGTLAGGATSIANGINKSGVIVGQSDGSETEGLWHAVKWSEWNEIEDLGVISGGTYSVAFAINDSNTVVGYGNVLDNAAHAMIWTKADGMLDLNSLISDSSWVLINANAINSSGQITGYGTKGGYNHAFLLTPKD
jgi:probable HAF family extracellular repeat protein